MHVAFMYFIIWPSSKEKEKETSDGEKDGEDWGWLCYHNVYIQTQMAEKPEMD